MDAARAHLLREMLSGDPFISETDAFASGLTGAVRTPGGLLVVGTAQHDPWHLTAHLDDEARFSGAEDLVPTLVRWAPPADAPAHLSIGYERIAAARRGEALLVSTPDDADDDALERIADARRTGATVFAVTTNERAQLIGVAHDTLIVPSTPLWTPGSDALSTNDEEKVSFVAESDIFDTSSHLIAVASGERMRRPGRVGTLRARLTRLVDGVTGQPARW
jgi:hypothetical protein